VLRGTFCERLFAFKELYFGDGHGGRRRIGVVKRRVQAVAGDGVGWGGGSSGGCGLVERVAIAAAGAGPLYTRSAITRKQRDRACDGRRIHGAASYS
jgi:hypothetical protein